MTTKSEDIDLKIEKLESLVNAKEGIPGKTKSRNGFLENKRIALKLYLIK
jgi:hypothetical protein